MTSARNAENKSGAASAKLVKQKITPLFSGTVFMAELMEPTNGFAQACNQLGTLGGAKSFLIGFQKF